MALLGLSQVILLVTGRQASRERQRLVNAMISRTPQEFHYLEAQAARPKRVKKAEAEAAGVPPIGL